MPEIVAEVEMSSANPVRGYPLPDWLQPFDENLVDEEQRVARVEMYEDIQNDEQERKRGSCCTRRKSSTARARQGEEERGQHITTWSIDYAFMIDNGDLCIREEMERVGWDETRHSVGERGSGHWRNPCTSCLGKWKRRHVDGKIKDDIEEFGYGGALVRIKSDQEPAIVDVLRAVIA